MVTILAAKQGFYHTMNPGCTNPLPKGKCGPARESPQIYMGTTPAPVKQ